jgi:hypothetical protein
MALRPRQRLFNCGAENRPLPIEENILQSAIRQAFKSVTGTDAVGQPLEVINRPTMRDNGSSAGHEDHCKPDPELGHEGLARRVRQIA